MNLNCQGIDPFETKNKFLNNWPTSLNCKFIVGLFAVNSLEEFVTYALDIKGINIMKTLPLGISHNIIIMPL